MIKSLNISNFGSFSNFDWEEQKVSKFQRLNILFGRNYSGKTTLSRIFRCLEVREFPNNYTDPNFEVFADDRTFTQRDIDSHTLDIRVYNTDFVSENLSFLTNENEGEITPFAIIGSGNKKIEKRIQEIEDELGDEERETGKKYDLAQMREECSEKEQEADKAEKKLNKTLSDHANDKIKKNRIYGEANYFINAMKADIATIESKSITVLETSEVHEKEKLLREESLRSIAKIVSFNPNFEELYENSIKTLAARIKPPKPIQRLLDDSLLQLWVRKGMDIHRDKERCGFCNQVLPEGLWEKLDAHFSQESSDLEEKIQRLIKLLEQEMKSSEIDLPGKDSFYNSVYSEFSDAAAELEETLSLYKAENQKLLDALKARQEDIFNSKPQPDFVDLSGKISNCIREINKIIERNNRQTQTLSADQKRAREELRLNDVLNFITTIDLSGKKQNVSKLKEMAKQSKDDLAESELHVRNLEAERDDLQARLQDEKKGADKVNEYLNHSFGLDSLKLVAEEDEVESKYKFQIMRGDKPAYNMSEGERSLISFCYFLAKLEGTETEKEKTIIYIDDPVSSLDSNHIFFLFSLIESVLAKPEKTSDGSNRLRYKQLFISTHNLDFLKYVKRLSKPGKKNGRREFFLVEKEGTSSSVKVMPGYLKDYQTEFIYLFHQVYKCSKARASRDNYQMFYSLGNNLRKFLEAFLFYKYPDTEGNGMERLRRFFGDDETTTALANRVYNELSHLEEIFDRGMRPIDIPELSKVASFVLDTIKEKDEEQYYSLLNSIGEAHENKDRFGVHIPTK